MTKKTRVSVRYKVELYRTDGKYWTSHHLEYRVVKSRVDRYADVDILRMLIARRDKDPEDYPCGALVDFVGYLRVSIIREIDSQRTLFYDPFLLTWGLDLLEQK